jgi:PAS domain S-box-containing protein
MTTTIDPQWLYKSIVEQSSDAIIHADREGIIRLWNPAAEAMFGYAAREALGKPIDLIIPDNLKARHWKGFHRVMKTGRTKYVTDSLSAPGQRKDGTRISLEFSVSIVRNDSGEVVGCTAILRDVTTRWQEDKELRNRVKELEEKLK